MIKVHSILFPLIAWTACAAEVPQWPQFRGPSGAGLAAEDAAPPTVFSPAQGVAWRADSAVGHGSLCIWANQIFLLSFDKAGGKLVTTALDRLTGALLWRQALDAAKIEPLHEISNPATATPATDGERVYVYFGSYGLAAYTLDGTLAWTHPLPRVDNKFGSGTSPVVAGGLVLLAPTGPGATLYAFDRRDGAIRWQSPLVPAGEQGGTGYSTPLVWNGQVVLHASGSVAGFDLRHGKRLWGVPVQSIGIGTPVAGEGSIFVTAFSEGGGPAAHPALPAWEEMLARYDKDKDGRISRDEIGSGALPVKAPDAPAAKPLFSQVDADHDGYLTRAEWERASAPPIPRPRGLLAILPGAEGDARAARIAWMEPRNTSEVPSPLLYHHRLYMVTIGGIVTCLDPRDGRVIFRGRLGTSGEYYASPVAAAGRVYFAARDGAVTVLAEGDDLKVLARNELGEEVFGTPAILGDTLYVRTAAHVYAFRDADKAR